MQKMGKWRGALIIVGLLILALLAVVVVQQYRRLTSSVQVMAPQGPAEQMPEQVSTPPPEEESEIVQMLESSGLNAEPVLGDTAISGHIARLDKGEVSEEALVQYANDLAYLNEFTAEHGEKIPTDFWDVRSEEMVANNWDEYTVVNRIAQPGSEPYLRLLAEGFGRFRQFKDEETDGSDTALDAALDMMLLVDEYYTGLNEEADPDDSDQLEHIADAKLMVWQSLVAGSTRINPLTNEPMFSHSIFARDNVGTMYQYHLDQEMGIAEVWGVSGFAPQFVGIPENNNQVEHMSISMLLQMVMDESVAVLDGIEEEKVLLGHARQEEAKADMALNNAIHNHFKMFYAGEGQAAVERLRCVLKAEDAEANC